MTWLQRCVWCVPAPIVACAIPNYPALYSSCACRLPCVQCADATQYGKDMIAPLPCFCPDAPDAGVPSVCEVAPAVVAWAQFVHMWCILACDAAVVAPRDWTVFTVPDLTSLLGVVSVAVLEWQCLLNTSHSSCCCECLGAVDCLRRCCPRRRRWRCACIAGAFRGLARDSSCSWSGDWCQCRAQGICGRRGRPR